MAVPLLTKAKVAAADFERIRTLSPTTSESIGRAHFPITGDVTFQHVAFRYPTRPDTVFADLSFSLRPGEAVAIVGPSGAGKSTVAALLQRLYGPTSGTIKLGNYDLSTADVKAVREGIAVVSQTPHLFDASVADNIRYGGTASLDEVVAAAKEARIHDFVAGLPQGYETKLGENASLISGGQAQRLQIARALLRHAKILILDEATSALDVENQAGILDTILAIKKVSPSSSEMADAEPHNHLHHAQRRRDAAVRPHHLSRRWAGRRGWDVRRPDCERGCVCPAAPDGRVAID